MDELIELLAEDSHRSWMQEKQRQGFTDHPYQGEWIGDSGRAWCGFVFEEHGGNRVCEVPQREHHPDMLPYADLPENVKEYDRVTVRGVLAGIERHGYRVVRADQTAEVAATRLAGVAGETYL